MHWSIALIAAAAITVEIAFALDFPVLWCVYGIMIVIGVGLGLKLWWWMHTYERTWQRERDYEGHTKSPRGFRRRR